MFTEEEVKTAKATRAEIISQDIDTLKGIYMAGEICMWDEMRGKSLSAYIQPFDKDDYEKLKKEHQQFINQAAEDMQYLLWEDVIDECEQYAFDNMNRKNRADQLMSKYIITKK